MPRKDATGQAGTTRPPEPALLAELEKKVLWLSSWIIHNANHIRENADGLKIGGHQASSASLVTIMTALYFAVLRPEDRVAVQHADHLSYERWNLCERWNGKIGDEGGYDVNTATTSVAGCPVH